MTDQSCYVCGNAPGQKCVGHEFWPADEAEREICGQQPVGRIPSMTAVETLDPREAVTR